MSVYMKHQTLGNRHFPDSEQKAREADGWVKWPRTKAQKSASPTFMSEPVALPISPPIAPPVVLDREAIATGEHEEKFGKTQRHKKSFVTITSDLDAL